MAKKRVQFVIDVDVEIEEKIKINFDKIKPELLKYETDKKDREERLLKVFLENDSLLWALVSEKAYFHLDELMDHEMADALEEASEESMEDAIDELEMEDSISFHDAKEHNLLADQTRNIYENIKPEIKAIRINNISK